MHHTPLRHAILVGLIALSLALPAWTQQQTTTDIGTLDQETGERAFPRPGYLPYAGRDYPTRVVSADGRKPGLDGMLPSIGNTADMANATWTNIISTPELITVWKDPDFDYSEGNGSEKFGFDIQMRGPILGVAIHFQGCERRRAKQEDGQ